MSGRLFAALASLVLTSLGLLVLYPPECAYACSCMGVSTQRALSSSDAVFSGEVVDLQKGTLAGNDPATLQVSEAWKGTDQRTLEVRTPSQGSACGYNFKEGQEYLVFAYGKQDLRVDACGHTTQLSKADADLAFLGNSEKPKEGGEALPDTGGVPVSALLGLAGLVMAGSFLLVVRLVRAK